MNNEEMKKKIIEILRLFEGRADRLREEIADALIVVGIGDVIDEFVRRVKERALQSCHKIINCYEVTRIETVIDDIADEMRQEVKK